MKRLFKLANDFCGLYNICGPGVAFKWFIFVFLKLPQSISKGDLQPADNAMGPGPFFVTLKRYGCSFKITGPNGMSGIREMYVRDVYLRCGWLNISPSAVVLDLGANMGNFTNMALSMAPHVRVVSVEPSRALNGTFLKSVGMNPGYLNRTTLIRGFLGQASEKMSKAIVEDENYRDAEWLTEEQLLARVNSPSIDFLKCDIEGGEFKLLTPTSKLLAKTKQLACEVHAFAGDVPKFMASIEACGFIIGPTQHDPDGTVTFLAKRILG